MRLVGLLVMVFLSGGVMAAQDNLNGNKFEQLEQMIKDLEGQMTTLTIENALLNDAVADLERDLGDAEFEITQLENTVAILSAGGGGDGDEVEYQFVGLVSAKNCPDSNNVCLPDWVISVCENTYGTGARITYINEWANEKFQLGAPTTPVVFTEEDWDYSGANSGPFRTIFNGSFKTSSVISRYYNISCSAPI